MESNGHVPLDLAGEMVRGDHGTERFPGAAGLDSLHAPRDFGAVI